ncbi:calmodulin-binding protein 25-like [Zingiber officinale]|uniref:VQ domain-containing protein n=1 Tax=Zingiber officinale TaxID=94328 RepID=A0A8J5BT11_ZINOF|nr:calmodulin-binding protein 25-like [Zingiber officinale]KAG6466205.1 hypothetical protein ZIOFF_075989 [Zingiber officinale]
MEEMAWISPAFAPDHNEVLARALQISLSDEFPAVVDDYCSSSSFVDALRRRNPLAPAASERISKKSKRKPRGGAGTRSQITYISADPANFREMVQRVTGLIDLEPPSGSRSTAPMGWPEPAQPALPQILLPTLDTSALFLNQFAGGELGPAQAASHLDDLLSPIYPTSLESWGVM